MQNFKEKGLTNNYDIFKAKLRDCLRYLDLRDQKKRRDLLKQSIESDNTRTAQTERLKSSFHSIKNFYLDLNCGDPKALKNLLKDFNKNKSISAIINSNGEVTEDIDEIIDSFTEYYSNLYGKEAQKSDKIEMQNKIIKHFSKTNNKLIVKAKKHFKSDEFKEQEVRYAIQKLNSHSAPGSDGFTSDLYKRNIDLFAPELTKLFNSIAENEKMPGSFCISIIKMLPKLKQLCTVDNFRPISLLNTDLKILSHVLASRLRKPLNTLIKKHQFAYLPNRSINTAILLACLAKEKLGRSNCMISINFSKAFDRLGRDYFLKLLNEIGCPLILTKTIESLYRETKACIEVNDQLSSFIQIENGIKQGCPLSALLFILGIEPLLQSMRRNTKIKTNQKLKLIAYADDITVFTKTACIKQVSDEVESFNYASGLQLNLQKTKVLMKGVNDLTITKVDELKILGIVIKLNENKAHAKANLRRIASESSKYSLRSMTLRARCINISTFVRSKLIYQFRHIDLKKTFIDEIEMKMIHSLWNKQKHSLNKNLLYYSTKKGGVGFNNLKTQILACKLIDLAKTAKTINNIATIVKFKLYKDFLKFAKEIGLSKMSITKDSCTIDYLNKTIDITNISQAKLHHILTAHSEVNGRIEERIRAFCDSIDQEFSNTLLTFVKNIWKIKTLTPLDKKVLYLLFLNSYSEKPKKWLNNITTHPLCYSCEKEFETFKHLFYECSTDETIRSKLPMTNINKLIEDRNTLGLKFLVAKLISSWAEEESSYMTKLYFIVNID